jgi:hypothetical protein
MRLILSLFRLFPFTLHVLGPYWPIIRGVLSCYYATIWFLAVLLTVRASVEVALYCTTRPPPRTHEGHP